MKILKRTLVLLLCICLCAGCFAGCHKKDEIAVKIGDYQFTAGYYACALVYADTEAHNKVVEAIGTAGGDTEDIDYLSQKIEGKSYEKWVKDRAIEILKEIAGYMALCEENKFELSDEDRSTAESFAKSYWEYYGYSDVFGNNGVSLDTFLKFSMDSYYTQVYFDNMYGKDGKDPVSEEDVKLALSNNFVLVNRIEISTTYLDEDELKEKKEMLEKGLEMLKNGISFADVYVDYDVSIGNDPRDTTPGDGETTALDPNAEIAGDSKSVYPCNYYNELVSMNIGECKIIETDSAMVLVKKLDIMADGYYLTQNDDTLRSIVVGDKADKAAREKSNELGVTQIKKAVNLFKVKKIKYPETPNYDYDY